MHLSPGSTPLPSRCASGPNRRRISALGRSALSSPLASTLAFALSIFAEQAGPGVPKSSFVLFMGIAMSITAFPVLARILEEHGITQTYLGSIAIACAAVDDATAWCLLAFVVGVAKAQVGEGLFVAVGTLAYIFIILFILRPLIKRFAMRWTSERLPREAVTVVFVAIVIAHPQRGTVNLLKKL